MNYFLDFHGIQFFGGRERKGKFSMQERKKWRTLQQIIHLFPTSHLIGIRSVFNYFLVFFQKYPNVSNLDLGTNFFNFLFFFKKIWIPLYC